MSDCRSNTCPSVSMTGNCAITTSWFEIFLVPLGFYSFRQMAVNEEPERFLQFWSDGVGNSKRHRLRLDIRRQGRAPVSHGRQAELFRQQAAHRRVAGASGDSLHFRFFYHFDQRVELLSSQADETSRLQGEFIVRANTLVNDMICAVTSLSQNQQQALDQVLDVGGAGPDIRR